MPPTAAEIKAVVKALDEAPEEATLQDVASLVINELDKVREAADKFITVARIKLPNGEWHNFAIGPYTTVKKAQAAGESFMPSTMVYKRDGDGRFRVVPLVNNDREAWEAIRPEQIDHQAYIKESVENWGPSKWIDVVKEKSGWGHKATYDKQTVDKGDDHS